LRSVTVILVVLLGLVHAELWLGHSGVPRVLDLRRQVEDQEARNEDARARNVQLLAEVRDLQQGLEMIEERARSELGMVKPNEILVQYTQGQGH
jgi:cell division protein FtsB